MLKEKGICSSTERLSLFLSAHQQTMHEMQNTQTLNDTARKKLNRSINILNGKEKRSRSMMTQSSCKSQHSLWLQDLPPYEPEPGNLSTMANNIIKQEVTENPKQPFDDCMKYSQRSPQCAGRSQKSDKENKTFNPRKRNINSTGIDDISNIPKKKINGICALFNEHESKKYSVLEKPQTSSASTTSQTNNSLCSSNISFPQLSGVHQKVGDSQTKCQKSTSQSNENPFNRKSNDFQPAPNGIRAVLKSLKAKKNDSKETSNETNQNTRKSASSKTINSLSSPNISFPQPSGLQQKVGDSQTKCQKSTSQSNETPFNRKSNDFQPAPNGIRAVLKSLKAKKNDSKETSNETNQNTRKPNRINIKKENI